MDEVLAQFVSKVLKRWNALSGRHYVREDVNCWRMEEVLGVDALGRSAEGLIDEWLAEDGFFEDLEPIEGAIAGFNYLRMAGHDVVIATSIPEVAVHSYTGKRRWLRKHFPDFSMKNMIAISRKNLLSGDVLIDDGAHNIVDWLNSGQRHYFKPIVYDAPWNQDLPATEIYRVSSWDQIVDYFDQIKDVEKTLKEP